MTNHHPHSSALPASAHTDRPADTFELRFTSTRRGARLARRLASYCLHSWGHGYGSEVNENVSLVVAELAANAVTHGAVPGRDALLRLVREDGRLRVEVSDTRGERLPVAMAADADAIAVGGRGLLIVGALAEGWGVLPRGRAPGKTVWAVVATTSPALVPAATPATSH